MREGASPGGVLVAVAHGSADPRASATIAELAAVARERSPGLDLRTAFLGHAPPSLPQVLASTRGMSALLWYAACWPGHRSGG